MAERIVYGQKDLEQALCDGLTSITLCAGIYVLPLAPGVMFDRLGPVRVSVQATRREAEEADMLFWDIYPEYKAEYAFDSRVPLWQAMPGSSGSFFGSGGSYSSSYVGSYAGSLAGSFGSFGFSSSFGSFVSSCFVSSFSEQHDTTELVLGYGIDLI